MNQKESVFITSLDQLELHTCRDIYTNHVHGKQYRKKT